MKENIKARTGSQVSTYEFPMRVWEQGPRGYSSRALTAQDTSNRKRVVSILAKCDISQVKQDDAKRHHFHVMKSDKRRVLAD